MAIIKPPVTPIRTFTTISTSDMEIGALIRMRTDQGETVMRVNADKSIVNAGNRKQRRAAAAKRQRK